MYTYIYLYTYIRTYTYTYTYIYIHIHTRTYKHTYIHTWKIHTKGADRNGWHAWRSDTQWTHCFEAFSGNFWATDAWTWQRAHCQHLIGGRPGKILRCVSRKVDAIYICDYYMYIDNIYIIYIVYIYRHRHRATEEAKVSNSYASNSFLCDDVIRQDTRPTRVVRPTVPPSMLSMRSLVVREWLGTNWVVTYLREK